MIEHANIFYISNFNVIGGTEQFIYEIAKKYYKYDIGVIYRTGHVNQIERIKKYVPVYQYKGQQIKCKKFFCNYESDIADKVEAEVKTQIIHAQFKTQNIKPNINENINNYFAVSERASQEYYELTGIKPKVVRNPLSYTEEEKRKPLFLLSATRLTPEKGKKRMERLITYFDRYNIPFIWLVFTNDISSIRHEHVVYMKPTLDMRPYLQLVKGKGYGVQLSDSEGDCYFTRECEALGIPLLATPVPSFKEQGLEDGINCYYLPFNMNITEEQIKNIYNHIPKYEGYIRGDKWINELELIETNYREEQTKMYKVKALGTYKELQCTDNTLKRIPEVGEVFEVSKERLDILLGNNDFHRAFVELIDEPKEEKAVLPKTKVEKAVKRKNAKK